MRSFSLRPSRLVASVVLAGVGVVLLAGPASAHVEVTSTDAQQGGYGEISFRVPTEKDNASTIELKVQLPATQPLAVVDLRPHPGWTATVTEAKLATPISSDDGQVTEAPSVIDWKERP